jgi:hypothetical protein
MQGYQSEVPSRPLGSSKEKVTDVQFRSLWATRPSLIPWLWNRSLWATESSRGSAG